MHDLIRRIASIWAVGSLLIAAGGVGYGETTGVDATLAAEVLRTHAERYALGLSLARTGRHADALHEFTLLLSLAPGHVDARLARGRTYAWAKQFDQAVDDLREVVSRSPRYADAWTALGDVGMWSGRYELAVDAYGRWVALAPDAPVPQAALGKAYQAQRNFSRAREAYQAALRFGGAPGVEDRLVQLDRNQERSLWSIAVSGSPQLFFGRRADWMNWGLTVKREWDWGSTGLGWVHITRHGISEQGLLTDSYLDLWPRAYGNVLVQVSPESRVIPRWDAAVEVFQAVASGWEAALRLRKMQFASSGVFLTTPAVATYLGDWFLRLRMTHVSSATLDLSWSFQARRYLGNADTYLEANAGFGVDEVAATTAAGTPTLVWSKSASVKGQTPVWPWMDLSASVGIQDDPTLNTSMTVGVELRFRP